jgi:branched-chain amino acid aminotransferase
MIHFSDTTWKNSLFKPVACLKTQKINLPPPFLKNINLPKGKIFPSTRFSPACELSKISTENDYCQYLSNIATMSGIDYNTLMPKIIFQNGQYLPLKKARILPYDLGFLRGYGVFDFMVTANGKPFMPDDHWKRLELSAKELGLFIPVKKEDYHKIMSKLLKLNKGKEYVIRTVLSGGLSPDGFTPSGKETFLILIEKRKRLPSNLYEKGASIITLEHQRDCPQAKINNYVVAIKNEREKKKRGALEILYTSKGKISEATTSNIFMVEKGKIITPKDKILFGITRKVVIKIALKYGYHVAERDVSLKEFLKADEAFLTASNKGIVPVVKVNGRKIGNGKVGKHTKVLMEEFAKFINKY